MPVRRFVSCSPGFTDIRDSRISTQDLLHFPPALTVVVQNSVPVARMGSATTSQQFIRQIGAALGVSAFVLAATVGGFRLGLLLMIAVSAGTFACVLALPAHSLHDAHHADE